MKSIYFYLLILTFLSACTPILYAPNVLNMPLPQERHEGKILPYVSSSDLGIQGSFAIDSHLVVLVDAGNHYDKNGYGGQSRSLVDAGAGYYIPLGVRGSFEVLGGFGNGVSIGGYRYSEWFNADAVNNLAASYRRIFFQSDIGVSGRYGEFAIGLRVSDLFFNNVSYFSYDQDKTTHAIFNQQKFNVHGSFYTTEPGLRFGFGTEEAKVLFGLGGSFLQIDRTVPAKFPDMFYNFYVSAGVLFTIGRDWPKYDHDW